MNRRLAGFAFLLAMAAPAYGQTTWYVDDNATAGVGDGSFDNPFRLIQNGIDAAVPGDEVVVRPGVYAESIDFEGKGITVRSEDPANPATVMATVIYAAGHANAVVCENEEGADTVLAGFVITRANGDKAGAGMFILECSPTVRRCTFIANETSAVGGGIATVGGSPLIEACMFNGNSASDGGGGVYNAGGGTPTIRDCSFIGNDAGELGGGMMNSGCDALVSRCSFDWNSAGNVGLARSTGADPNFPSKGGGIYNVNSNASVTDCSFRGNGASNGGGIYNDGDAPTLLRCAFIGNLSIGDGAGVYNNNSSPTLDQCIFSANTGDIVGGMYTVLGLPVVTATGFCGNSINAIGGSWLNAGGNSLQFCMLPAPDAEPCAGDVNGDGTVNIADLLAVLSAWGGCH